jgi:hypothetical protein
LEGGFMDESDLEYNEYLDLPEDSELGFARLQRRKFKELEGYWEGNSGGSWYRERQYVDTLVTFDEVHGLGILTAYQDPPARDQDFGEFFQDFQRVSEIASQKIMMESARRLKTGAERVIVLDTAAREAVHSLVGAIRSKLNELALPESKRESLFNKLNAFAAEVDRNRTRTEAFYVFAVETARTAREVHDELKPLQQTIDRVFDWIEKAKKWSDALPPWSERKKIEGPQRRLSPPTDLDDEIPF